MRFLNTLDCGIIIGYFVILVAIGIFLKRLASSNLENYFLGGRKMPWWALGLSNMTAWVDMTGTMMIASFIFILGPQALYIEGFRGGGCLVLASMLLWLGKWHRRSGCMTGAEWNIFRFGNEFGGQFARIAMVIAIVISTIGLLAYTFVGAGLFLSMFLPYPPVTCSLIMLAVTILYTMEAGFYGVVFTDVFQSVCIWIGVIFIAVMAIMKTGSGDLAAVAVEVTGNSSWMNSFPQWQVSMPKGYEPYSMLTVMAAFYLSKTVIQGLGGGADPRYFGAKSDRDCGLLSYMCGWTLMLRWVLMIGFVILGLYLVKDLFPDQAILSKAAALIKQHVGDVDQSQWAGILARIMNHPSEFPPALIQGLSEFLGPQWSSKLSLLSYQGTVDPERILPAVLLFNVPMGLRGILLVALLAAAMSTINAFVNLATGFWTKDIYQTYIHPKAGNKELIYSSYAFSFFLVACSFIMAFWAKNINDIWAWLAMGLAGGIMVPSILRLYWWRFNGGGFAIGMCAGILAAVLQRIIFPDMLEWQQFVATTSVGLFFSIAGTYFTKPTDRKVLENFYIKTRPFGLWGPLKNILPPDVRESTRREHFNDIVALPFTLGWQIAILLIPLQIMIGSYKACGITLVFLAVCMAGMHKFWYKNLPPREAPLSIKQDMTEVLSADAENR